VNALKPLTRAALHKIVPDNSPSGSVSDRLLIAEGLPKPLAR
jgi:hypothetical protein